MEIIIQKFGGTSVKDAESREQAFQHIKKGLDKGYKIVVVVSAMGRKGDPYATDTLLELVNQQGMLLQEREQDLLLSCGEIISAVVFTNMLLEKGIRATALTGGQAGFRTNNDYTNAKIIEMKPDRLLDELEVSDVIVVTGFQGVAENGDITTIGRGGSDTSAAALGAALKAEYVDIFTDVEGIMTADPRIAEQARPLSVVTYTEVCNMAYQGAKVIHPRAVEIAMQAKVPLRIRSTYTDGEGTLVTGHPKHLRGSDIQERLVTGIAHVNNITQIKVKAKDGQYDLQAEVFTAMAKSGISVDFINIYPNGVVYTVSNKDTEKAVKVLEELGYDPKVQEDCAKVSVVGAGITGVPGVTAKIVTPLSERGIQILQSADSHTTIWVLVKEKDLVEAVNALHAAFNLHLQEDDSF